MSNHEYICETEKISAYVDGELETSLRLALEEHLPNCRNCSSELELQRMFMCELDSAMANPFEMGVPANFAQVVAVNAESDMRGVRDRAEHARAFKFCLVLGVSAFALLGATSSKALFLNARVLVDKTFGVISLLGRTIYDAAAGVTVVSRVFSRGVVQDSPLTRLFTLLFLAVVVGLLTLLISRYHRTRAAE